MMVCSVASSYAISPPDGNQPKLGSGVPAPDFDQVPVRRSKSHVPMRLPFSSPGLYAMIRSTEAS